MKKKYYKISATHYFSILIYLYKTLTDTDMSILNNNAIQIRNLYHLNRLELCEINRDYLYKMIKCCGNVIFNKNENNYFGKPSEVFPVILYFHFLFKKNYEKEKILNIMNEFIQQQLEEFSHSEYAKKFVILSEDKTQFINNENNWFKSLIHFVNTYYKSKKIKVIRTKRSKHVGS